jgi:hypothetical protein
VSANSKSRVNVASSCTEGVIFSETEGDTQSAALSCSQNPNNKSMCNSDILL